MAVKVTVYGEAKLEQIQRAQTELKKLEQAAREAQGGFGGAMARMGSSLEEWGGKMTALGSTMTQNVTLPLVAVGAGIYKLTEAAAQDAQAQEVLANTLRNTAGATDAVIASTEEWITAQGKALGVTDDQLRPALGVLAGATGDVAKAQELAALAMDVAAAKGIDVETAATGLAKAYAGNLGALKRLVPGIDEAAIASGDFAQVQAALSDMVGGAATTAADTQAGAMQRSKVAISEAGEELGAAFLPILEQVTTIISEKVVPAIEKFAGWFGGLSEKTRTTIVALGGAAAAMGPVLFIVGKISTALGGLIQLLPLLGKALTMGLGPWGLIIGAIAAIIAASPELQAMLLELGGTIMEALKPAFDSIMEALGPLLEQLGDLLAIILPPLAALIGVLAKLIAEALVWAIEKLTPIITWMVEAFSGAIQVISGFVQFLNGEISLQEFANKLLAMKGPFGDLARWAFSTGQAIGNFVRDVIAKIRSFATAVADAVASVIRYFRELPGKIRDAFGNAGDWLVGVGRDIVNGLRRGIENAWSSFTSWVNNLVGGLVSGIRRTLGISSPSRVFADIGRDMGLGLQLGIESMQSLVSQAAQGLASAATMSASSTIALGTEQASAMLTAPAPAYAMAGAGSTNVSQVTIAPGAVQITFEGSTDSGDAQRVVEDAFAKLIRELRAS